MTYVRKELASESGASVDKRVYILESANLVADPAPAEALKDPGEGT